MIGRALLYLLAIGCAIGFTVPFIWTIGTSLKPVTELYNYPPSFVPATAATRKIRPGRASANLISVSYTSKNPHNGASVIF